MTYCMVTVDFPDPAGPIIRVLVPVWIPPPSNASSSLDTTGDIFADESGLMLCGDEPGIDDELTGFDTVVMKAFAKFGAAQLTDFQTPALDAEVAVQALHHQDAVRDALELKVSPSCGAVVEQEARCIFVPAK